MNYDDRNRLAISIRAIGIRRAAEMLGDLPHVDGRSFTPMHVSRSVAKLEDHEAWRSLSAGTLDDLATISGYRIIAHQ